MTIPPKVWKKLERTWLANVARQRLEDGKRRLQAGQFTLELMRAPDDPGEGAAEFQKELQHFGQSLSDAGVPYQQTALALDSVEAHGYPLPEFIVAIKQLGPPVIAAVGGYATAWVQARLGRKVRVRIGEVEAEGCTLSEIKALLQMAAEFQDRTGGEREGTERSETDPE